jgi:hypothetical protein
MAAHKVEEVLEDLDLPIPPTDEEPVSPGEVGPEAPAEEEEEALEERLSPEDPVRLYLREIGRVALLTGDQEVRLGQQIERGQERMRRAIMAFPTVRRALMDVGERLRKREAEPEEFLQAPDGTALSTTELKRVLAMFGQIRRLERQLADLEAARRRARKAASRKAIAEWIAQNHQARVRLLGDLPLKPFVVDRWVARLRQLEARCAVGCGKSRRRRVCPSDG